MLRNLLESKDCPVIVYTSRTHRATMLAQQLREDGFDARAYHGKMDMKQKKENQDAFMAGKVRIIVATSAFGMGVDKKDVGMVIIMRFPILLRITCRKREERDGMKI